MALLYKGEDLVIHVMGGVGHSLAVHDVELLGLVLGLGGLGLPPLAADLEAGAALLLDVAHKCVEQLHAPLVHGAVLVGDRAAVGDDG